MNFITGAGGFLQSVIFGYGGLRLRIDSLEFDPNLPENVTRLGFDGITYLGNKISCRIDPDQLLFQVTEQLPLHQNLILTVVESKKEFKLELGKIYTIPRAEIVLKAIV